MRRLLDIIPLVLLLSLLAVFGTMDRRILAPNNLKVVVLQATPILMLALGAFFVLLSGGIDLSAGFSVTFCCMLIAGRMDGGSSFPAALGAGLLIMVGIGLFNGLMVGYLNIPPFVVTMATMIAVQGATLSIARSGVLIMKNPFLKEMGTGVIGGWFPKSLILPVAAAFLMGLMARYTRLGLRTYALGSDSGALALTGVNVPRQRVCVYVVSAVFTFLASVVMISRVMVISPTLGGGALLMDAIAAAVIGGTSIFGGRGTVSGVVCGVLIVSLLTNAIRVLGVDPSGVDMYKGIIIIAALIIDAVLRRVRQSLESVHSKGTVALNTGGR